MKSIFHSNGKIFLAGEYVVLDGAIALTIPTKYGQSLSVTSSENKEVLWQSFDVEGEIWFEDVLSVKNGIIQSKSSTEISRTLVEILQKAKEMNPSFLENGVGYKVTTKLDFPRNWGLGTSSTLVNNIAQWANVDAFHLLWNSFGGSGFDIAAAQNDTPVFYQQNGDDYSVKPITLPWDFTDRLHFIHLNQKQNSKEGILQYRKAKVSGSQIEKISDLCKKLLLCYTLEAFENVMESHEKIISEIIKIQPIKERLFPDFSGIVKSLGAWGGDFILATGTDEAMDYFRNKGFTTIIPFAEMIK